MPTVTHSTVFQTVQSLRNLNKLVASPIQLQFSPIQVQSGIGEKLELLWAFGLAARFTQAFLPCAILSYFNILLQKYIKNGKKSNKGRKK